MVEFLISHATPDVCASEFVEIYVRSPAGCRFSNHNIFSYELKSSAANVN